MKIIIETSDVTRESVIEDLERVLSLAKDGYTSGYNPDWTIEDMLPNYDHEDNCTCPDCSSIS